MNKLNFIQYTILYLGTPIGASLIFGVLARSTWSQSNLILFAIILSTTLANLVNALIRSVR